MRGKPDEFKNYFEKMGMESDDFKNIKSLLNEGNFFLGVRENCLSIYYMAMSLATVNVLDEGGCSYTLSYFYLQGVKKENGDMPFENKTNGTFTLNSSEFWNEDNQKSIKENVKAHIYGFNRAGKKYLEKACQQWIIDNNNSNPASPWYYVDMEYVYKEDGTAKEHPFGRADIIAISKERDENNLFRLAFVELKVGTDAFGISIDIPTDVDKEFKRKFGEDKEKYKKARADYRKDVEGWLKNDFWGDKISGVKLGSGIASHVVDFMHFFGEEKAKEQIREEIVGILNVHRTFGLINENIPLFNLSSACDIEPLTDIYIVTYSKAPHINKENLSPKAQSNYSEPTMAEMKAQLCKYLFDSKGASTLPVETLLKGSVDGIMTIKDKYINEFMTGDEQQIECMQKIKNEDYRFVFRFLDISNESTDPVRCI